MLLRKWQLNNWGDNVALLKKKANHTSTPCGGVDKLPQNYKAHGRIKYTYDIILLITCIT